MSAVEVHAVVAGPAEAPVLDFTQPDGAGATWHHRATWTTVDASVIVVLSATWRGDAEPPADLSALLPVAVERAATLPARSPRPSSTATSRCSGC